MFKRTISLFCVLLVTMSLCACQLARPDGLAPKKGDRLVGAFLTSYHLDLYRLCPGGIIAKDATNESPDAPLDNYKDQAVYMDDDPCNGRIYADKKEDANGSVVYEFKLDGVPLFLAQTEQESLIPWTSFNSSAVSDYHATFGGDSTSIEGTVYTLYSHNHDPGIEDKAVYMNPVYQAGDGSVYLKAAKGGSVNLDGSMTLEEAYTMTENGKTVEEKFAVTVNFAAKDPTASIHVIQMSAENTLISQQEYSDQTLPENIVLDPSVEYIIVETRSPSQGGEMCKREIFSRGAICFTSYKVRDDGFFLEQGLVNLLWETSGII